MGGLSYHLRANPSHRAEKMGDGRTKQSSSASVAVTPGGGKKKSGLGLNGLTSSAGESMAEVVGDGGDNEEEEEWEDVVLKMDPDDVEVQLDGFQDYLVEEEGAGNGDYFMGDYAPQQVQRDGVDDPLADIQWM